ncbi:MAG TPA: hypothetical protein VFL82_04240, partial [Thermomicrobiales bacterium]|nr:hypothetical protein [Thermomicrobiales bacterium]
RLLPGALPADLPFELPLPPKSRLVGSFVGPSGGTRPGAPPNGHIVQVLIDVPTGPADALAFYERAMTERGWQQSGEWRPYRGGFTPFSALPPSRTFCQGARGPHLTATAHERPAGGASIRILVDTATPGPCAFLGRQRSIAPDIDPIPMLLAPSGVLLTSMGGGGGGDAWHSDAISETDLSIDALEAGFATQLAAGGWTPRDRRVEESVAWSTWTVPGEAGWRGLLLVVAEPTPNRRYLHVRAELDVDGQTNSGAASGWVGYEPGH